jgi:hypothetical protein
MSTIPIVAQVSADKLLEAIEKMDQAELEQFVSQVIALQARRRAPGLPQDDSDLLIKINQGLPADVQTRLNELIVKRQAETFTPDEHDELLHMIEQSEQVEAARVEALAQLARLRGVSLTALMHDLGIKAPDYA